MPKTYCVQSDRAAFDVENEGKKKRIVSARARACKGRIDVQHLGAEPLLEVYFIDVGQGDGVLIRTPDDRHVLIDGGYIRSRQASGKNGIDFVDWKFSREYGRPEIHLDAIIASRNGNNARILLPESVLTGQ